MSSFRFTSHPNSRQSQYVYYNLSIYNNLQVGNGDLTINEQRSHFALWALLKSPLMVGTDLAKLSNESYKILLSKEVIAVNQDELGIAGDLVWKEGPAEVNISQTSEHLHLHHRPNAFSK